MVFLHTVSQHNLRDSKENVRIDIMTCTGNFHIIIEHKQKLFVCVQ
jgi:hypothetical protein